MIKKITLLHAIFIICSLVVFSDEVAARRSKARVTSSESARPERQKSKTRITSQENAKPGQQKNLQKNDSVNRNTGSESDLQKGMKELAHKVLADWKRNPDKEKEFEKLKSSFESLKSSNLSKETQPKFAQLLVDLYNVLGVISFSSHVIKLIEELNAQEDVLQILSAIKKLKTTNSNQTYKVLYKALKNKKSRQLLN